jgi:pyruvate/2-oxoacid:ferredoxin oxidoreductase beta subunit
MAELLILVWSDMWHGLKRGEKIFFFVFVTESYSNTGFSLGATTYGAQLFFT